MIVSSHPEIIEDGLVEVSDSITIRILDSCQFGALHHQEAGIALCEETQWLV